MADTDQPLPLGIASVTVEGNQRQFPITTAGLTPRRKHHVRLTFTGERGSVTIDLPRRVFWDITWRFHEQSASAEFWKPKRS